MKDWLINNGFNYVGSCNCRGPQTHKYEKDNLRIEINTSHFWIAKRMNGSLHFTTVQYGNAIDFESKIGMYL